jgi:pimeloyl-ACP methyl ester carboxylesterase
MRSDDLVDPVPSAAPQQEVDMDETMFRDAEERLWSSLDARPSERFIRLRSSNTALRVQEVGEGPPILFLHGAPNAGSTWATLVTRLAGFRCLLPDRPGTGLSEPVRISRENLRVFADDFVSEILDGLGLTRAHLVASSFGGYIGLRSAAAHPDRIDRMVQMGCPALAPGMKLPLSMRLMSLKSARTLLGALPPTKSAARSTFRQMGHGASIKAGRIPDTFFDWYVALQRFTDTMRNEGDMIGSLSSFAEFDPRLTLTEELLGSIETPTYFLWGRDDAFAGAEVARSIARSVPDGELEMVSASGHLPWLDDPGRAAKVTMEFFQG